MASPTDFSGLACWLAADAITGLSDGDPLPSWVDGSGYSRPAYQSDSGSRPVFRTGELGGLPAVRFNGFGQWLTSDWTPAGWPLTVIALAKTNVASAGNYSLIAGTGVASGQQGFALLYSSDSPASVYTDAIASAGRIYRGYQDGAGVSDWAIASTTCDGSTAGLWIDGASVGSPVGSGISTVTHSTTFRLGRRYFGADWAGDVAEVIVYEALLSDADREAVEAYLTSKWFGGGSGSAVAKILQQMMR